MNSLKKNFHHGIWLLKALVRGYQWLITPTFLFLFGSQAQCRYEETCSRYFIRVAEEQGFFKGCWFGFRRILSCHPWSRGKTS